RNSNSIRISSVEVWSGESIDSIKFTYTDNKDGRELKSSSTRHGGSGGSFHKFELEDGEHIVRVSGRHEVNRITQLSFGTSQGRTSEVFGAGKGQSFSALAPRDKDGNYFRLQYICGKSNGTSLTGVIDFEPVQIEAIGGNNNRNAHPPDPDWNLDIFASTSLEESKDKDTLVGSIGASEDNVH
ncbi:hypothetical protein FRC11_005994, partial [Ceratobasidium sp. 423]